MRADPTPARGGDRAPFFSRVMRLRTRAPGLRSLPRAPEPFQGTPYGFSTPQALGHALLLTDLGGHAQRPETRRLPIRTRGLRQDRLPPVTVALVQRGLDALGAGRLLRQAPQTIRLKSRNAMAYRLPTTAPQVRNGLGGTPTGTRQHEVGTAYAEGVSDTAFGFQLGACLIGQGADKASRFQRPSVSCDDDRASWRLGLTVTLQSCRAQAYHRVTLCTTASVEMH